MVFRSLTTLACVLFIFSISVAQKDFRPGYVVKDGDTLKGLLRYGGKRPSEAALFKSGKRDKAKAYTPAEATAYGFLGDKQYVAIDIGDPAAPQKVFALALQKGEIDLYYTKGRYMLIKDNELTVLDRKPDSVAEIKNTYGEKKGRAIIKDLRYIDQLNTLVASDCGLNASSIQFSRRQISAFIGKYNKCRNNYVAVKNTKPVATIGASLGLGVYGSTLEVTESPGYTFKGDISPVWQFDVEVKLPRLTDRISISLGVQPVKTTYRGTATVTSTTQTRHDDLTLQVKYVKIPVSFKYNFGNPGNSSFVRVGAWQGILNKNVKFTTYRTFDDGITITSSQLELIYPYRNPAGAFIGIGYDKNIVGRLRMFGELRYEKNSGFIGSYAYPSSSFNFISAFVGVAF